MALYTILFGLSIFLIALVMAIIKKMFFHWKQEHKIERMIKATVDRPEWLELWLLVAAVSIMISTDKCLFRLRKYTGDVNIYDVVSKSDIVDQEQSNENVSSPRVKILSQIDFN